MIRYALRCGCGHEFDEWFASMADYDDRRADLRCPECGGAEIGKAIMAPSLGRPRAAAPAPLPCGAPACAGGHCAFADAG